MSDRTTFLIAFLIEQDKATIHGTPPPGTLFALDGKHAELTFDLEVNEKEDSLTLISDNNDRLVISPDILSGASVDSINNVLHFPMIDGVLSLSFWQCVRSRVPNI